MAACTNSPTAGGAESKCKSPGRRHPQWSRPLVLWLTGERPVEVTAFGSRAYDSRDTSFQGNDLASLPFCALRAAAPGRKSARISRPVHPHYHRLFVYGTQATFAESGGGAWRPGPAVGKAAIPDAAAAHKRALSGRRQRRLAARLPGGYSGRASPA